ncbi:hypothetical protein D3C73_1398920 [compost metagenome]
MIDGRHRDQVEIAGRSAAVNAVDVQRRTGVPALAVDQHQHMGRGQAAQGGRAHHAAGIPARAVWQVEGGNEFTQCLQQARFADRAQLIACDHVDRCRAGGDGALLGATVASDDHGVESG